MMAKSASAKPHLFFSVPCMTHVKKGWDFDHTVTVAIFTFWRPSSRNLSSGFLTFSAWGSHLAFECCLPISEGGGAGRRNKEMNGPWSTFKLNQIECEFKGLKRVTTLICHVLLVSNTWRSSRNQGQGLEGLCAVLGPQIEHLCLKKILKVY